jgi:hypothetical protein
MATFSTLCFVCILTNLKIIFSNFRFVHIAKLFQEASDVKRSKLGPYLTRGLARCNSPQFGPDITAVSCVQM